MEASTSSTISSEMGVALLIIAALSNYQITTCNLRAAGLRECPPAAIYQGGPLDISKKVKRRRFQGVYIY